MPAGAAALTTHAPKALHWALTMQALPAPHAVPAAAKPSAGQADDAPVHVSGTSQ